MVLHWLYVLYFAGLSASQKNFLFFAKFFLFLLPAAAALGGCPYTTVKMGVGWGCRKNFFGCRCAPSFFPADRGGVLLRSWFVASGVGGSEIFRGCCSRCRSFFVWLGVPLYDVYNGAFFPIVKIGGGAVPRWWAFRSGCSGSPAARGRSLAPPAARGRCSGSPPARGRCSGSPPRVPRLALGGCSGFRPAPVAPDPLPRHFLSYFNHLSQNPQNPQNLKISGSPFRQRAACSGGANLPLAFRLHGPLAVSPI